MKTIFKFPACVLSAALLLCLALPIQAQPKPVKADAKAKPAVALSKDADPWERRLPEVQFDNLPLTEVVNYLSDAFPEVNFVVQSAVREIPVSLKLRSVTLDDIFSALDITAKNPVNPTAPPQLDSATGLPMPPVASSSLQITKVNERMVSFTVTETAAFAGPTSVCRAFSLNYYLAGKADKEVNAALTEIEEALQIAWKMLQEADKSNAKVQPPQLSLHRATKLLIVVGQPSQVEVVEQVISQLNQDVQSEGRNAGAGFGRLGGPGVPGGAGGYAPPTGAAGPLPPIPPSPTTPGKGR